MTRDSSSERYATVDDILDDIDKLEGMETISAGRTRCWSARARWRRSSSAPGAEEPLAGTPVDGDGEDGDKKAGAPPVLVPAAPQRRFDAPRHRPPQADGAGGVLGARRRPSVLPMLWWLMHRKLIDEVDNRVPEAIKGFEEELGDDIKDLDVTAQALSGQLATEPLGGDVPAEHARGGLRREGRAAAAPFRAAYPDLDIVLYGPDRKLVAQIGCASPQLVLRQLPAGTPSSTRLRGRGRRAGRDRRSWRPSECASRSTVRWCVFRSTRRTSRTRRRSSAAGKSAPKRHKEAARRDGGVPDRAPR